MPQSDPLRGLANRKCLRMSFLLSPYPRIYISLGAGRCEAGEWDEADTCVLIGAYAMSVGGSLTRNEADFHALYPTLTMFHPATAGA